MSPSDLQVTLRGRRSERGLLPQLRVFYSVREIDGKKVVRNFSNREHIEGLPTRKDDWYERMWDPQVFIRGDIASVWTPYDSWVNGEWSHCGIDQVTLVRIKGTWKITGGAYTVEKECESSPLGPLKKD